MPQPDDNVFELGDDDFAQPKKASSPWKYILLGCGFFALMFAVAIGVAVYRLVNAAGEFIEQAQKEAIAQAEAGDGAARFRAANSQIDSFKDEVGFGNSEAAVKLAQAFSQQIGEMREDLFTKRKKPAKFSLSKGKFLVYCQLDGDRCAFLVHVPDLRKFDNDAKEFLGVLAWATAQAVIKNSDLATKPQELGVGTRGIMFYDRVIVGELQQSGDDSESTEISLEGDANKHMLYSFFEAQVEEVMSEPTEAAPEAKSDVPLIKPETPENDAAPAKEDAPKDPAAAEKEKSE